MRRGAVAVSIVILLIVGIFIGERTEVRADLDPEDEDGDGRPDLFEDLNDLDYDPLSEGSNDIEWTFLCYVFSDDTPAGGSGGLNHELWWFIEKLSWVGCTDNINIVVQFDGTTEINGPHQDKYWYYMDNGNQNSPETGITRRFLVGTDTSGWDVDKVGQSDCYQNTVVDLYDVTDWPDDDDRTHDEYWEANMADPEVLYEFISWGMDTFPSENYCLYFIGHGDGVAGFGYDYRPDSDPTTTTKDVLTLSDIQSVSLSMEEDERVLDIVMLYSCCMGNLEFCLEFNEMSDFYIGSENLMLCDGNQDDVVLGFIDDYPNTGAEGVGIEFIDTLWYYSRNGTSNPLWDISDWPTLANPLGLTYSMTDQSYNKAALLSDMATMNSAILSGVIQNQQWYENMLLAAYSNADVYPDAGNYKQMDYYYFCQAWALVPVGQYPDNNIFPGLKSAAISICNRLASMKEYERHDTTFYTKTNGLAIYCPGCTSEFQSFKSEYEESTLDEETNWSHVLECLLDARGV